MSTHTEASILIDAPFDEVWRRANDLTAWPELFAGEYSAVEILRQEDAYVRFRLTTEPDGGASHTWESERFLDRTTGTVIARRLTPGPFRYMHLIHHFIPHADGTQLRWVQDFEVRPGAPLSEQAFAGRIENGSHRNLARHKEVIERAGPFAPSSTSTPATAVGTRGHIDVRVLVDAPPAVAWDVANDRKAWARTGHPVQGAEDFGQDSTFAVTTPPDAQGRSWSFTVHRSRDDNGRTVFSRRLGCPDFVYSLVWFSYEEVGRGTEMRCVSDFEMAPGASATAQEMETIMSEAMRKNLERVGLVARQAAAGALGERS